MNLILSSPPAFSHSISAAQQWLQLLDNGAGFSEPSSVEFNPTSVIPHPQTLCLLEVALGKNSGDREPSSTMGICPDAEQLFGPKKRKPKPHQGCVHGGEQVHPNHDADVLISRVVTQQVYALQHNLSIKSKIKPQVHRRPVLKCEVFLWCHNGI